MLLSSIERLNNYPSHPTLLWKYVGQKILLSTYTNRGKKGWQADIDQLCHNYTLPDVKFKA